MKTLIVLLAVALFPAGAGASPRQVFTDTQIVERAQLIVVAHIKPDSLKRIDHPARNDKGKSHETRGMLVVTEILKGQAADNEIPIIIHYGLDPTAASQVAGMGFHGAKPDEVIALWDNGGEGARIANDIRKDYIWLLRIQQHWLHDEGKDALGIYDPEDIQPITKKQQLQALVPKA